MTLNKASERARRQRLQAAHAETPDLRASSWMQFADDVDAMLSTSRFDWAASTLRAIHADVIAQQRVTDRQRAAVDHIYGAQLPRRRGYWW
jgi:hypothetical protein